MTAPASSSSASSSAPLNEVRVGGIVISIGLPRVQGIIIKRFTNVRGSDTLGIIEAPFQKRKGAPWTPAKYVEKTTTKLPVQETPAAFTFSDIPLLQKHLSRLLSLGEDLEEADLEPMLAWLNSHRDQDSVCEEDSSDEVPQDQRGDTHSPQPLDILRLRNLGKEDDIEELRSKVAELTKLVSKSTKKRTSHDSDSSDAEDDRVSINKYSKLYVPCPFSDDRSNMQPAQRSKVMGKTRRTHRLVLGEFYGYYKTALNTANIMLGKYCGGVRTGSWEECMLLQYAEMLDAILLDGNEGSWRLWSEFAVDVATRGFLEMLVRINPERQLPHLFDHGLEKQLKKTNYGNDKSYGPLRPVRNWRSGGGSYSSWQSNRATGKDDRPAQDKREVGNVNFRQGGAGGVASKP